MTSALTARRFSSPPIAVMVGWVCVQAACSLTNLDYLTNGDRRDGAIQEAGTSSPDMEGQGYPRPDATHGDSVDLGNFDLYGPSLDSLVVDTRGEVENGQGMDASTPDMALLDGANPNAPGLDAPLNLDNSDPANLDAPSGADTASGGTTGTADAGTSQGGAGADGNTATGGQGGAGTAGNTGTGGTGGTSLMDGGEDEDTAAGGQGGAGAAGSTGTGGTGGTSLMDGGPGVDTATGGQGGARMDAGADTSTCSGVLRAAICWYLGPQGNSCQQVCTNHGAPAPDSASHVGTATQGGSNAECKVLLGLLGISGTPTATLRLDGQGLGCYVSSGIPWWIITLPNFSVSSSEASSRLVCGCTM
jgi:hypothetical protein